MYQTQVAEKTKKEKQRQEEEYSGKHQAIDQAQKTMNDAIQKRCNFTLKSYTLPRKVHDYVKLTKPLN